MMPDRKAQTSEAASVEERTMPCCDLTGAQLRPSTFDAQSLEPFLDPANACGLFDTALATFRATSPRLTAAFSEELMTVNTFSSIDGPSVVLLLARNFSTATTRRP
jgi:hypothetical protein